ncbi:MAG: hypothetical protein NT062_16035 [Proteobacteria bacterium]|nr:hypothetical protein [Pseudomonadota bacterium]
MKKSLVTLLVVLSGSIVLADGSGSGSGSAAGSGSGSATVTPVAEPAVPTPTPAAAKDLRKTCTAAMNADPTFAAAIVKTADETSAIKRDQDIIDAHQRAAAKVAENERHVILAYAAMWILSIIFVIVLWRKQGGLNAEIATLRRDLEAALATEKSEKAKS